MIWSEALYTDRKHGLGEKSVKLLEAFEIWTWRRLKDVILKIVLRYFVNRDIISVLTVNHCSYSTVNKY